MVEGISYFVNVFFLALFIKTDKRFRNKIYVGFPFCLYVCGMLNIFIICVCGAILVGCASNVGSCLLFLVFCFWPFHGMFAKLTFICFFALQRICCLQILYQRITMKWCSTCIGPYACFHFQSSHKFITKQISCDLLSFYVRIFIQFIS